MQHSPVDKLIDMLLAMLLDCDVVSQVNTKLAQEVAVLQAFGREKSADQSTVQRTLSSCNSENVAQLQQALAQIFATNSRSRQHKFGKNKKSLFLDIDLTGLPCSKHYEGSKKGTSPIANLAQLVGNFTGSAPASTTNWSINRSSQVIPVQPPLRISR